MKSAQFINFSNEAFTGYWNSEPTEFGPLGSSNDRMYMEDWKARHFAKHLANRELLKKGEETHTSPKNPEQDVIFMDMFNQAYSSGEDDMSEAQLATALIDKNIRAKKPKKTEEIEEEFPELNKPAKKADSKE